MKLTRTIVTLCWFFLNHKISKCYIVYYYVKPSIYYEDIPAQGKQHAGMKKMFKCSRINKAYNLIQKIYYYLQYVPPYNNFPK